MGEQQSALAVADVLAGKLGLLRRPLQAEKLCAEAERLAGSDDYGPDDIIAPLTRLLDACTREAELSMLGLFMTRWDVLRFLRNLLCLREEERRTPAILEQEITAPLVITGVPRSGTSFLHALLLQDERHQGVRVWQTLYPCPDTDAEVAVRRVERQLRLFERLAPEFSSLHPLQATSAQECSEITAHVFQSLRFDMTYRIPSYRAWLDAAGQLPAYRFHRRFLQHLQYRSGQKRRWVLKCPDHVFALEALRAVYPDVRLVFVHRNPLRVLASITRLTEVVRRPFTHAIDRLALGAEQAARWHEGAERMIAAADLGLFATPICHVHYDRLVADPLGTLAAIHRHFGDSLPPQAEAAAREYVARHPHGGYGEHHYALADYGLDAEAERARFARYRERFAIAA